MTRVALVGLVGLVALLQPAIAAPDAKRAEDHAGHERIVRVEHRDPGAAPARGPVDAPVTIELFFVPTVGLASSRLNAFKMLEQLQAKHPTRVRLIWRVLRQGMISTAALEAHAQGKFFEFVERIAAERAAISKDKLFEITRSLNMDADRVAAAIQQDRYGVTFNDNERRSKRMHLTANPAVLFNSQPSRVAFTSSSVTMADLEKSYADAYQRALDLLEQGIPPGELSQAFDQKVLAGGPQTVVTSNPSDDDSETHDQMLASPPLVLTGLPSVGDDDSPLPVVFLCSPGTATCQRLIEKAIALQKDVYPDLRLVWAPWFDVGREDAAELAMLGDAALCAEQLGAGSPPRSAGWLWVETMYKQVNQSRRGRVSADQRLDSIAKELDVDTRRLATCRARSAGASLDWIAAARQSGVRMSPSIIIGGRIYAGLSDVTTFQQLIEAELAPGISDSLFEHLGYWPR